jgi:hypothetical protein
MALEYLNNTSDSFTLSIKCLLQLDIENNVTKEQDKILQLEEQYSSKYIKHARENLKVLARAFSRGSRAHAHTQANVPGPNHTQR